MINIARREDFDPMELKTLNVQQETRRIDEVVREREKVAATEGGDEWQSASSACTRLSSFVAFRDARSHSPMVYSVV